MTLQYRLLGRLEAGELAELYRAERDDQKVVIKLFHPRTSEVAYAKAVAETQRLLTNVMHPGVSHVLDIGLVKHRLAVVREDSGRFTLGTALQRLNTKEVLLALPLALTWVIELLDVVQQAHAAGVVHGALTPGNVMLTPEGRPAVCDFGALAALNASPQLKKNFGGRGRNNYRAPEAVQADAVSVQSDLYSLGAITYELLTLREPTSGAAQMSTRREAVPPPSRLDRRINSRLDPIILRAIEHAPARRFKSCADFAEALRDFLSHNGGLPQKDDLKRFINELFPKEVNADAMGPVPFAERFGLTEVDGAELEENDERSMVIMARKAFSGGEVDHTAETSEALPQFAAFQMPQEKTDVGRKETEEIEAAEGQSRSDLSWDAPPSAQPVARKAEAAVNNAAVMKRLKVKEDFEALPKNDTVEAPAVDPKPKAPARAAVITTPDAKPADADLGYAATPADSHPISEAKVRDADGKLRRMITEERNIEAARKQRAKMMGLAATFLIFGLVIFVAAFWMRKEGLLPGGPPPRTRVPPVVPPKPKPDPDPAPKPPPPKAAVEPPPVKPVAKIPCYDPPPKKGAALLTVVVPKKGQFRYELDGEALCDLDKVPVKPGAHKLTIYDLKAGTKETESLKLAPGANFKFNP